LLHAVSESKPAPVRPQVEKLQSKFEVISAKTRGSGDDGSDEPKSQAYYVIKAAQEREELQREVGG
jgi:hypothetical protein